VFGRSTEKLDLVLEVLLLLASAFRHAVAKMAIMVAVAFHKSNLKILGGLRIDHMVDKLRTYIATHRVDNTK
jgi:hypothetical protein